MALVLVVNKLPNPRLKWRTLATIFNVSSTLQIKVLELVAREEGDENRANAALLNAINAALGQHFYNKTTTTTTTTTTTKAP